MQTSVTFKNIEPSDSLKSYVSDKLDRFDKYLYNPAEANVVLSVEKFRHIADVNIVGDGLRTRAEITNFWEMVFNPSSVERLLHVESQLSQGAGAEFVHGRLDLGQGGEDVSTILAIDAHAHSRIAVLHDDVTA